MPPLPGAELTMSKARKRQPDLEKSLAELEKIVATLEEGDIPLEQALKQFEKGIKLSRECQTALQSAEQRVQVLMNGNLEDFDSAETLDE
jgi:exodeoxyribonuclease VII small subunit